MATSLQPHHLALQLKGGDLLVHAEASVPTLGWTGARLEEVERGGGVLRLRLMADPPDGMAAQMMGEIAASLRISSADLCLVQIGELVRPVPTR